MSIGIDASNLRQGGGRTHLIELLRVAEPSFHGFERIVVWGSQSTLKQLDDRPWLVKMNSLAQEGGLLKRILWQCFYLSKAARAAGCNILFVPGGSYFGNYHPMVTMSRNMLPFEWVELLRYGPSFITIKLFLLRLIQARTMRRADGMIFLTQYAKNGVESVIGKLFNSVVIAHGLNDRFLLEPGVQRSIELYTEDNPFRLLYVSIIDQYKHQWHVVEAVAQLRNKTGWHLVLYLVGPAYHPALKRLQAVITQHDPGKEWVRYLGTVPFDQLHTIYKEADMGLFASSCENMPNILLETMASGLPVASSNRGPMQEIIGEAGVFFDPENSDDIAQALESLIADPEWRWRLAKSSYSIANQYTWKRCADETFAFLAQVRCQYLELQS